MISDALELVIKMRSDNGDVFPTPEMLRTCYFIDEEVGEFYRAWEKITRDGWFLRRNDFKDVDLRAKLELEFGQSMMMLLTAAQIAKIDPDSALRSAIENIYKRCAERREELSRLLKQINEQA